MCPNESNFKCTPWRCWDTFLSCTLVFNDTVKKARYVVEVSHTHTVLRDHLNSLVVSGDSIYVWWCLFTVWTPTGNVGCLQGQLWEYMSREASKSIFIHADRLEKLQANLSPEVYTLWNVCCWRWNRVEGFHGTNRPVAMYFFPIHILSAKKVSAGWFQSTKLKNL